MEETDLYGSIRGTAKGVFVERPNKPGKVFKLRDVRHSKEQPSKDQPSDASDPGPTPTPSKREYGSRRDSSPSRQSLPLGPIYDGYHREPSPTRRGESSMDGRDGWRGDSSRERRGESSWRESSRDWRGESSWRESSRDWRGESGKDGRDFLRGDNSMDPARDFRSPFSSRMLDSREPSKERFRDSLPASHTASKVMDSRLPSKDGFGELALRKVAFEPSEEFKSWLNSALEAEREVVHEVIKGRHVEILSQMNFRLEPTKPEAAKASSPAPPQTPPAPLTKERLEQTEMPGVLVVREDYLNPVRNMIGVPNPAVKKVSLTDDTDARSLCGEAGDDKTPPPRAAPAMARQESTLSKSSATKKVVVDPSKSRGAMSVASSRVTHNIPHLRKNSLLDGLMELPFWHPGRYVHTTQFDAVFCGVILLNTFVMALEMQYMGLQRGYELGFPNFVQPASEYWQGASSIFAFLEVVFGVIYLLELIIKLIGFKMRFFKEWWNWFDGILVVMWLAEFTLRDVIQMDGAILRMMRMARLLRLIRLVKTIQGFDALYIMTTALMGSTVCLFWSFMLLMTVQIMIAFFLNESLETYFQDKTKPVSEKLQVFEYFGTTARVMLTMFELTLANWPVAARILQENVTEYYSIFSVAYKLIIGFAAVGIINGVFMQETFKVAASDDKLMMRQKERDRWLHTKKMRVLFQAADESGDGYLDREEFLEIMNIPEVRTWLAAQELPVRDPNMLFNLLDDGDAELTAEELVKGVERLKGTAKGIDLASFMAEHRSFAEKVAEKLNIQLEHFGEQKKSDDEDDDDEDD
ncbi:unnamed protein product [Effrenium voratum]|nr:unnamed protein product [Effrenium voratum]